MRKIGFFNIGKLGLVKSAGKAKTDISKVIEKWVKEHMVFWTMILRARTRTSVAANVLKNYCYTEASSGR